MTLQETQAFSTKNGGLEIVRLDRTGWRVSDPTIDERDPRRLIGYIERLESNRYEVLWLVSPISWAYVDSFEHALTALEDRSHFPGTVEPQRDPTLTFSHAPASKPLRRR